MKQQCSILMLMARSTFYKVLLLLLALAGLEVGLFCRGIPTEMEMDGFSYSLEAAVRYSGIQYALAAGFVLLTLLLCTTGLEGKSKLSYTIQRLPVSEGAIYLWQSLYNTLCYALLWGVQIVVAVALAKLYAAQAPAEVVTSQTVVLAFYRNSLFHAILPFEDWVLWVRNILFLLALGLVTAQYPVAQRRGKRLPVLVLICAVAVLWSFPTPVSYSTNNAVVSIVVVLSLSIPTVAMTAAYLRRGDDEDETT